MKKLFLSFTIIFIISLIIIKKTRKPSELQLGMGSLKNPCYVYELPNKESVKLFKLLIKNWPVYIIKVEKNWALIKDSIGSYGWIKKHNLKNEKYTISLKKIKILREEKLHALIEQNALLRVESIGANFCKIWVYKNIYSINKKNLWIID